MAALEKDSNESIRGGREIRIRNSVSDREKNIKEIKKIRVVVGT